MKAVTQLMNGYAVIEKEAQQMSAWDDANSSRRGFLRTVPWWGAAMLGTAGTPLLRAQEKHEGKGEEEEVSTNEDLMREHGVLKRVLLIYDEIGRRIRDKKDFPPQAVSDSAKIIRDFIENYHEKLEEDYLFPRFQKAGKLTDLVSVLLTQHRAGRRVTERILATIPAMKSAQEREKLAGDLHAFVRMYAPHEAREDTVLFPALHKIVSPHEYDALGDKFESIERQKFGGDGFEMYVEKVTGIEKQLGIYDLAQFTPR
ncbi:MAG TPA: hemerythrin domain-containing protein [Terriglobales bacterium]|nr:hemerythrin domain-containing protein [Terriglobales bacterium]